MKEEVFQDINRGQFMQNFSPKGPAMRARAFALVMHAGQLYDGKPYIFHLDRVAELAWEAWGCELLVAAAYLHDVIEDTPCDASRLAMLFGIRIATNVYSVTGVGETRKKKQQSIVRKLQSMFDARKLKLVDRVANVEYSILTGNAKKLAMYRKEEPIYHKLFASLNHPLALRLEAMLLPPSEGLCVCVLVERDGKQLAVQRRHRPEFLGLPGGKVDPGEVPVMAAIRELYEETGYHVRLEDLQLVYCAPDETGVVTATFLAKAQPDWPEDTVGPEGTRVAFVAPEELTSPQTSEFAIYNEAMLDVLLTQRQLIPLL